MLDIPDNLDTEIIQIIEAGHIGRDSQYKKGKVLLWQGDRVQSVLVIKEGAVKIFSISYDGRIYTYGIIGKGGLVGGPELLHGERAKVMAQAITDIHVKVLQAHDFLHLLTSHPRFSLIVAKKFAKDLIHISDKAKGLGFFDVEQRLKHTLLDLALEYGIKTDKGIRITLDITHKDIAELIGANRTTITYFINELKRQGYLSKEGKYLVINEPDIVTFQTDMNPDFIQ